MTLRHQLWLSKTFVSFVSTCALLHHMIPALNPLMASYIIGPEQTNLCQVTNYVDLNVRAAISNLESGFEIYYLA